MESRALVVDDDRLLIRLVELNLGKIGVEVSYALDGAEAIRLAVQERPDIILLDIMMPRMDGYEVMRQLRSKKETRDIPIIMLTAKTSQTDRRLSEEMGAAAYITKPFRIDELRGTVRRVLRGFGKSPNSDSPRAGHPGDSNAGGTAQPGGERNF